MIFLLNSYLQAATRHLLEEGVVPSFYVGKLQYHPQLRVPSCLILSNIAMLKVSNFIS